MELEKRLIHEGIAPLFKGTKIDFCKTRKRKKRFESEMNDLEKKLSNHVKINAKPKKYDKFLAYHPEEYSYEKNYEKLEFEGTKLHTSIGAACFDFEVCLSNPYVKYSNKNQHICPTTTMISTIFRQGVNLGVLVVEQKYRDLLEIE